MMRMLATLGALAAVTSSVEAAEICVTGWNLESTESRIENHEAVIRRNADCDIFVLSEVESDKWVYALEAVIEDETDRVMYFALSGSGWASKDDWDGGPDALAIIYDMERFDLLETRNLHYMTERTVYLNRSRSFLKYRAPFTAIFADRESGMVFEVVGVHLARPPYNRAQSAMLVQYAKDRSHPIIAAGDFNYDYEFRTIDGEQELRTKNDAYEDLTYGGVWRWAVPEPLARTTCNEVDGNQYDPAILDFVFLANANWPHTSSVLETQDGPDCKDNADRSDHRPVRTVFTVD